MNWWFGRTLECLIGKSSRSLFLLLISIPGVYHYVLWGFLEVETSPSIWFYGVAIIRPGSLLFRAKLIESTIRQYSFITIFTAPPVNRTPKISTTTVDISILSKRDPDSLATCTSLNFLQEFVVCRDIFIIDYSLRLLRVPSQCQGYPVVGDRKPMVAGRVLTSTIVAVQVVKRQSRKTTAEGRLYIIVITCDNYLTTAEDGGQGVKGMYGFPVIEISPLLLKCAGNKWYRSLGVSSTPGHTGV